MTGGAQFCNGSDSREGFRSHASTPSTASRAKTGYSETPPIDLTADSRDGVDEKRGTKRAAAATGRGGGTPGKSLRVRRSGRRRC